MLRQLELYYLDLIKGKKRGFFPSVLKGILWGASGIFYLIVRIRNWAYDTGWLRCYYPPVPLVISVGNIVAGGAGKTPTTLMIAKALYNDFVVGVIARGYRSQAERFSKSVVLSKGQGPLHPATFCGDEPYLIAQQLPEAIIIVGKNRQQSAIESAKLGAQVIVMDDAMQHRRIARDLEVVVIDVKDPDGLGYYLPRGLLREGMWALGRADLIILNHSENTKQSHEVQYRILKYTTAPVVATKMEAEGVLDLENKPVQNVQGKKVGSFCGIAHPEYFRETLEELKMEIVDEYILGDHEGLHREHLYQYALACQKKGAEALICTEKDRVKLSSQMELPLPIYWVKMRLHILEGQQDWNRFIEKAKNSLKHL